MPAGIFQKNADALYFGRGRCHSVAAATSESDSDLHVRISDAVDNNAYARWACKLKNRHPKFDEDIEVSTPVSKYVPKDRFIPDGMSSFTRQVKRVADCLLAWLALILFSPLFLICYIAVKWEDGGPAIFKQERIGRFGRPFNIYKFRSMRLDAEKFGPQLSHSGGDNDPRLTRVGRFLRAHHLDELPQLWNVFCGDMAFIGPCRIRESGLYRPDSRIRHALCLSVSDPSGSDFLCDAL